MRALRSPMRPSASLTTRHTMALPQSAAATDTFSDSVLIALARQGSEVAVRGIVRRYNRKLYRTARAILRDDSEAEDVVQETYVRALSALDSYLGDAQLGTWLTRIAANEALGRLRRRRPTVDLNSLGDESAGVGAQSLMVATSDTMNPETQQSRERARLLLEECVAALPDAFRAMFVLRQIEENSTEETAALLGIKPETVKTRLHRARLLLRQALGGRFGVAFADLFPFDGARCERIADAVVARLRHPGGLSA